MDWRPTPSSDLITRQYLDSLLVEVRHLDACLPDTHFTCFGKSFAAPITTGALSHLHNTRENGMAEMARGACLADMIAFSGMGPAAELEGMVNTGASVIKIIKTYQDRESIARKIRHAESCGAFAVGMDIDHAFSRGKGYDCIEGMEMRPLTTPELKDFVASTSLPFVIKGVLSMQDALKCKEAGVKGIVISHHNGRLDYSLPPLMALPRIREVVGNDMVIFVDCAIESGLDVLKSLALGADACSIGRPLMGSLKNGGAEEVAAHLRQIQADLSYAMAMTCCHDLSRIQPDLLHKKDF